MAKVIKIVAIEGSMRPDNNTAKALHVVVNALNMIDDVTIEVIDPRQMALTMPGQTGDSSAEVMQKIVKDATGVIIATPEYHGSYSSVTKLIIDNLGFPSVLAGKPIVLLGVAAGRIGAIKALEHLRSVCSHVGALVLPGPVSVAEVHKKFDDKGQCTDSDLENFLQGLGIRLVDYIRRHICPGNALEETVRED